MEKNIYQRLNAVMQAVSYVQKEDKKVNNQYTFVSHDAVTAKIRPALIANGILMTTSVTRFDQDGNRTEVLVTLEFINIDKPEDRISVQSLGYGIDPQDKGPGKAVSYAVKYGILKTLCLETGDDPERDMIEHQPKPKEAKGTISPAKEVYSGLSPDERVAADDLASYIKQHFHKDEWTAFEAFEAEKNQDIRAGAWAFLDSKIRSRLKQMKQEADKPVHA